MFQGSANATNLAGAGNQFLGKLCGIGIGDVGVLACIALSLLFEDFALGIQYIILLQSH